MKHPIVYDPPTLGGARAIIGALLKLAGLALLLVAVLAFPSFSQQPAARTLELNTFGRYTNFAPATNLEAGLGGGFRLGYFVHPRWELEGGVGFTRVDRIAGPGTENVVPLLFDVTYNYPIGWYQLLLGGGAVYNKYGSSHAWGTSLSGGVRLAFGRAAALRVDGTREYLNKRHGVGRHSNWGLRLGLSWMLPQRTVAEEDMTVSRAELISLGSIPMPLLRESYPIAIPNDSAYGPAAEPRIADRDDGVGATIRFDTGSSKIRSDAMAVLEQKLDLLRNAPTLRIRIEGQADVPGATAYNITLAWDRAGATRVWLTNRGIDPDRIEAVGFSRSWTQCEANDNACWSRFRREEFLIVAGADSVLPGTR
jgi:outer membrane protein OmpA-like peptidoglycan-associated protein